MDSIKLIEDTSFHEKQVKSLKKGNNYNNYLERDVRERDENESRRNKNDSIYKDYKPITSADDLYVNLYPENSFKFPKSSTGHKQFNQGVLSSLNGIPQQRNGKYSYINSNSNFPLNANNRVFQNNDIESIGSLNEEKFRNLFKKKK